jgi:hypothetical protein
MKNFSGSIIRSLQFVNSKKYKFIIIQASVLIAKFISLQKSKVDTYFI